MKSPAHIKLPFHIISDLGVHAGKNNLPLDHVLIPAEIPLDFPTTDVDNLPTTRSVNSLTPKSVQAGTKNSRSEGFLLVKQKHTNIPTMMEPFAPPTAWDLWILPIVRADPLPKGSGGGVVEGI